ncbi:extradiol dioxygenase [Streptomyces sp. CB01635]|uniref:VOC family protein n=1 Tax=unclassified Streptomyces TaxID=2593676 RepID=UPI000C272D92|nr:MULTISPECIES: VOC family protein [unclassified Streptomyces]PJN10879.1 extradiol dioxygenase [Streptomyces sp. CB01635]
MELAQVRLLVSDFRACYHFYADVLGLKPQSGAEDGPYEKFSPTAGSAGIGLEDRALMAQVIGDLSDAPDGHRSLVVLRVDDLDEYCEQIVARGAEILHGPAPMTDRMRVAHLKDPEGNIVELQEWLLMRG